MPPPPTPCRLVLLLLSAAILLSNLAGAGLALVGGEVPVWGWFGFEAVMAVASVFGVLLGLGKFREGWGLAAACVAGAWFVGTGLGRLATHTSPGAVLRDTWFLARTGGAGLVALAGAYAVLSRDRRSIRPLIRGFAFLAPIVLGGGAWVATGGGWLGQSHEGGAGVLRMSILIILATLAGGLFCAGAHFIIRAFEHGVPPDQPGSLAATPASKAA